MYIEEELWYWIEGRYEKAGYKNINRELIEKAIDECGIWISYEGMKYDTEDFDMTLEECFNDNWFIIDDNKTLFTNPDIFADQLDEYLGIDMSMYD